MYVAKQFSIFMVNKPGVLARMLGEFAEAKLNITAITMMDTVEQGVMRVVFANPEKAEHILKKLDMPYNETSVLCVTLTNQSGALATVAEKLSLGHINISYAYCTAGAKGGRTTGILKVANVQKAMKILQEGSAKKKTKSQPQVRRPQSSRR
ncbi:MAG: ACT domain-containing protein [Sedimentisphaerales bacterium]|nr:ACT domain-containing protein [Sedimentisphaerales bacterium]